MKRKYLGVMVAGLFAAVFASNVQADRPTSAVERWDFDVYLNDKRVGQHVFEVVDKGDFKEVQSNASFK